MSLKVIKSIKIAPSHDEITITDTTLSTDFAGGIIYSVPTGLRKYEDKVLKEAFAACIAMSSKAWQIEKSLNKYFKLYGRVTMGGIN